jgi:16S rRNA (cytosine967-C5)-methyltransferase
MDSVPSSAVCNEAVKIATKKGFHTLKGFVNGVLRNISRNINDIQWPEKGSIEELEVKYSMPSWIIKKWIKEYSKEDTIKILEAFLKEDSRLSIRCNTSKIKVDELVDILASECDNVERSTVCDEGLKISGYNYLSKMKSFKDGLFYVQDESSMVCVDEAMIKEGDYVVDVCAAPGGKSIMSAIKLAGTGMVDARDINDYKVGLIEDNIERMKVNNITAKVQDATKLDKDVVGKADVVIADLPCSGLGVIGKKTDIKYNVTESDLEELASIQSDILEVVKEYVKDGGTLLYSTCTINKGEHESNVEKFLDKNKEFKLEKMVQMLPGKDHVDGFFIARMRKK